MRRALLLSGVLLTAILLSTVVAPALQIGQVRPDIVVLSVVAFALADGPATGARYGFVAGLAVDLLSGDAHVVGVVALVLTATGWVTGALRTLTAGSLATQALAVGLASLLAALGLGIAQLLVGAGALGWQRVLTYALGLALYHAVLTPLLVRPVMHLWSRLEATSS